MKKSGLILLVAFIFTAIPACTNEECAENMGIKLFL
jgi:hypothetical protein